jgi:membrane protease YdiL (CAAX protease family)
MRQLARTHPVALFYLLACIIAWAGWAPLVVESRGLLPFHSPLLQVLLILPAAAPALAAAIVWRLVPSKPTRENVLRSFLRYRVRPVWYALAVMLPAILLLSSRLIEFIVHTPSAPSLPKGNADDVARTLVLSVLANPWEEVGWRAFALPHLQASYGPIIASLLIGDLSGFWHVPMFYLVGNPMSAYPYWPWFTACVGTAMIATWLFNGTGRSLLLASIFHVALNVWSVQIGIRSFYPYAIVTGFFATILGVQMIVQRRRRMFKGSHPPVGDSNAEQQVAADREPAWLLSSTSRRRR